MDAYVPSFFEPLDQHLQTVRGQLLARNIGLFVIVAEPCRVMVLLDTFPVHPRISIDTSMGQ